MGIFKFIVIKAELWVAWEPLLKLVSDMEAVFWDWVLILGSVLTPGVNVRIELLDNQLVPENQRIDWCEKKQNPPSLKWRK